MDRKQNLKVTFLLPPLSLTGGIKVVAIHARHLLANGHDVFIVSPGYAPLSAREWLRRLLKTGELRRKRTPSHLDKMGVPHHVLSTHRAVTDADLPDADVVVATWWETAEWMSRLSPSKGRHVHLVQGYELFWPPSFDRVHAVYRMPVKRFVVSQWLQEIMAREYGDHHTWLVPNGVDEPYRAPGPERVKAAVPTVGLLLSRAIRVKGMDTAMEVLGKLRQRRPDFRCLAFAGDSVGHVIDLPEGLVPEVDPPTERITDIYRSCDVWLSCSTNEGFNLTVVEAMATGTPVVATSVGWPAHGVLDHHNGFLCEVDDVDALAHAVDQVLSASAPQWAQWSAGAKDSVMPLTWQRASEAFLSALEDVVRP